MAANNFFLLLFNLFSVRKQNKNGTNQDYPLHGSNIYDFSKIATDQNLNDLKTPHYLI
jgi:hypothetical protein